MDQVSLYRKYRPHNFDNLVGQDYIKNTLVNALKSNRATHAYLFTGPRGTGKTSTARLMAKALCCATPIDNFEPCDKCEFCNEINDGRLIDLIEIDAASNRGIDEVRDLKEKINFAPTRAKYKIYIIDEVHMMTKEAFNALLKTLEEPPAHAYFVLATTEIHKVPATIISRCQRFDFKRITIKALMTRLSYIAQKEGIEFEEGTLEAISKYSDGGLRDAIGLMEQLTSDGKLGFDHVKEVLGVSDFSLLEKLFDSLEKNEVKEALGIVNELHGQGSDLKQFIHEFVDMLRVKVLTAIESGKNENVSKLIEMIETFQEAGKKLDSEIPQLPLEMAVIKVAGNFEPEAEPTIADEREHKTVKQVEVKNEVVQPEKIEKQEILEANLEFTLTTINTNWPRITERVTTPALRMSLKNAAPIALEGPNLTLEFSTNFDRDKVMENAHRAEFEKVIEQVFGHPVKVIAKVKALEIKSVVGNEQGIVDEALEIFGGEVVE